MAPITRYEVAGGVATITLDQPDTRNALSDELLELLPVLELDVVRVEPAGRRLCRQKRAHEERRRDQRSARDEPQNPS